MILGKVLNESPHWVGPSETHQGNVRHGECRRGQEARLEGGVERQSAVLVDRQLSECIDLSVRKATPCQLVGWSCTFTSTAPASRDDFTTSIDDYCTHGWAAGLKRLPGQFKRSPPSRIDVRPQLRLHFPSVASNRTTAHVLAIAGS